MEEKKVIRQPAAIQLLADETRMKMIYLLRAKEMTVSQISAEVGLTPQTIYHHIKKLKEAEMVEVSREERMDHLTESYYRATAGMFYFSDRCGADSDRTDDNVKNALKGLDRLGFKVHPDADQLNKIVRLLNDLHHQKRESDITGKVYQMNDLDSDAQEDLIYCATLMSMGDTEFKKHLDTQKSLRQLLLSKQEKRT